LPKYFKIIELLESRKSVTKEAKAKINPTYFSEIILDRNVEPMYAGIATCKEKRNETIYILFIFEIFILIHFLYI
jgi:hypothetical protein